MIKEIITEHIKKYSKAEITDIVKLIYQNEFGGGHLIKDKNISLERIKTELKSTPKNIEVPLTENIGNGIVRLNFAAVGNNISAEAINECFVLSANEIKGSVESFENKISEIFQLCKENILPFNEIELGEYMHNYKKNGYPAVSHSPAYRTEYSPSYRIMKKEYAEMLEALTLILNVINKKKQVIAIDGRCASGKTTFANTLKKIIDSEVIHTDDFFLPFERRTSERLNEPGGNIDYERFESEVINGLRSGKDFTYGVFNCSTGKIDEYKTVSQSKHLIIEGSYSLHPKFRDIYDVKVFMSIPYKIQLDRILKRNGPEMLKMFKEHWIPMEEKYFDTWTPEKTSDIIISSDRPI